jgi:hypothetical protein
LFSGRAGGILLPIFFEALDNLYRMISRQIFQGVAWLLVVAVAVFTLGPVEWRPNTGAPASLERFAGIALITGAFCLGYPRYRLGILVLVIGGIGLLEVAQDIIPGRHGKRVDLAIKVAGALIGGGGAVMIERLKPSGLARS